MAEYYYTDANRQPAGPLPYDELKAMYERGELADGALVAEVGADAWQEAAAIFGDGGSTSSPKTPGDVVPPVVPTGEIGRPSDAFEPLAGWAFGLGIASWMCGSIFTGVPGVILGHIALNKIKREGNTNSAAKVLGIIGLVLSYLAIAGAVFWFFLVVVFGVLGSMNP